MFANPDRSNCFTASPHQFLNRPVVGAVDDGTGDVVVHEEEKRQTET